MMEIELETFGEKCAHIDLSPRPELSIHRYVTTSSALGEMPPTRREHRAPGDQSRDAAVTSPNTHRRANWHIGVLLAEYKDSINSTYSTSVW